MMTAVCDLFFAPKGIASGGGHGNSLTTFGTSGTPPGSDEVGCGWLETPAAFFVSVLILGGFALL